MMDLIDPLFNELGMWGVIALAAVIVVLLLSLFKLFKPKPQTGAPQKRAKNTELLGSVAPRDEPPILDNEDNAVNNPPTATDDTPQITSPSPVVQASQAPPSAPAPVIETLSTDTLTNPQDKASDLNVPQIILAEQTEPETGSVTIDPIERENWLRQKLEHNPSPDHSIATETLELPADALSPELTGQPAPAALEKSPPQTPPSPTPELAGEQMLAGLARQTFELDEIEKLEQSIEAIHKKVEAVLAKAGDQKKAALITDQVSCSVFAPSQIPPGQSLMAQVFLHVDADLIKVRAMAQEIDQDAERRLGTARLKTEIVRDAMIDIVLEGQGLEIDEQMQSLIWQGAAESVNFIVTMPEGTQRKDYFPIARLFIDGIPIGHIKFKLSAVPEQAATTNSLLSNQDASHSTPQGIEQRTYKRAFISYSRKNFELVSHFNEGLINGGYKTFFDLESLDAGTRWSDEIKKAINHSDVFFLCWTLHAKQSQWVDKEILHAISQQRQTSDELPTIVPISFETPMPEPPHSLSHLHFNSRHQLIRAGVQASLSNS